MISNQSQIKINLPKALKKQLELRAGRFDMPIAGYVRYLIVRDASEGEYPTYAISKQSEERAQKALLKKRNAKEVKNMKDFLSNL